MRFSATGWYERLLEIFNEELNDRSNVVILDVA